MNLQDQRAVSFCTAQVFARFPALIPSRESFCTFAFLEYLMGCLLKRYMCVPVSVEVGTELHVLALTGTIPTVVGGITYHTPIIMYFMPDFPRSGPVCFVNPTKGMPRTANDTKAQPRVLVVHWHCALRSL